MRLKNFVFVFILCGLIFSCNQEDAPTHIHPIPEIDHPRILLLEGEEKQIQELIDSDEIWKKMHLAILEESENILTMPELEYDLVGYRLLGVSRELLKRVFLVIFLPHDT